VWRLSALAAAVACDRYFKVTMPTRIDSSGVGEAQVDAVP